MELYTPVLALMILAAGFAIFSVVVSSLTGPKRYNRAKLDSYECGIEPTPQPVGGGRFPVRYYITAMMFIVFDIEIVFLYPIAVAFDQMAAVRAHRDGAVHRAGLRGLRVRLAPRRPGVGLSVRPSVTDRHQRSRAPRQPGAKRGLTWVSKRSCRAAYS